VGLMLGLRSNMIKKDNLHKIPRDFKKAVSSNFKIKEKWGDITELARNEFICWVTLRKI
jgi:hypothetical protein